MKLYKVLNGKRKSCNGGIAAWKPGVWMPEIKDIEPCERGYHLYRKKDLINWLNAEIWEAEGRGEKIVCKDKIVFSEARITRQVTTWNEKTARLFAADCAEHVLPIWEKSYPNDDRPRKAILATREYAHRKISKQELENARDAARDAAWAARDAAWDAAWDAAGAAARDAAWDAWAAAWDAAWDAWAAAWDAARKWQIKRLNEYLSGRRR